jgi:hypothetical protein
MGLNDTFNNISVISWRSVYWVLMVFLFICNLYIYYEYKPYVKYVIKRLWHEIFHIVPGINPQPISALQLRCRAWYGSLWLIPGPIWKTMSYVVGLPSNSYKFITYTAWVRPRHCKLQKRVHPARSHKW